jgi:hypothetical protein
MAKVSRTPRKTKAPEAGAQDALNQLFGDTSHMNPEPPQGQDPGSGTGTAPTREAQLEARVDQLMQMIGGLSERLEQSERVQTVLTQPVQPQASQAPVLSFDGLPDPLHDHEGYARALTQRIFEHTRKTQDYEATQRAASQQSNDRYAVLWEDFSEAYPALAEDQERARFAVQAARDRAARRGLDVDRYMFSNPTRWFKDIEKEYNRLVPDAGAEGDDDDTTDGRTAGIFGGQESGNRPATRAEGPGDLIRELQAEQRKLGLF